MAVRTIRLPGDLVPFADMLIETFQYPENPEWSVQEDEQEDLTRELRSLRRLWPAIRVAQALSKPLRDLFRGFVWDEDGRIGAAVISQRRGATNMWTIGAVGVLPEFRRRGLARQLLTMTLEDVRKRGGTHIVLAVIDKNVPAYSLYRSLGFEHYSSQIEYHIAPEAVRKAVSRIPSRYSKRPLKRFDWKTRYTLANRITPDEIAAHEPVTPERFRSPAPVRLLMPVLSKLQRRTEQRIVLSLDGTVIGHGGYRTTKSQKGTSSIWAEVDPEYPDVAKPLLEGLLADVNAVSPTLRIQLSTSTWMPALCEAAKELGFQKRVEYHWLGLELQSP
jgi:ribosomal protein S18 acetylase RimI-like enzyme